ncbi:MAG: YjgP/YjgQ family permease, partial [Bacteroidetes bacterium]
MKKLHKLLLTSYIGPFLLTFFIALFILVMQFLWKYIDEMVGKGLEWYVIAELLIYASANLIPLALPMAVLLSSIMTFGNLGESYELVAMKSAGLSLIRIMKPLIIFTVFLSISAFFFSNHVWPKANLKFASLLYDIRHKKPAIDIQPGIFYRNIEGYVIRVGSKEKDGKTLYDVMIFDHVNTTENNKILYAEKGVMSFAGNDEYLELKLYNGYSYNEIRNKEALKNRNYPLMRTHFKEQIIRFDLTGFKLKRSNQELFKNNYQMLNLAQLERQMDTLKIQKQTIGKELLEKHSLKLNYFK